MSNTPSPSHIATNHVNPRISTRPRRVSGTGPVVLLAALGFLGADLTSGAQDPPETLRMTPPAVPSKVLPVKGGRQSAPAATISDLQASPEGADLRVSVEPVTRIAPPGLRSAAARTPLPKATSVVFEEGFEGLFPGPWTIFDADGATNGEVFWGDVPYRSAVGSWSAWCAARGINASPPGENYLNNMRAWMIVGPFDFSDAIGGSFSFNLWLRTEQGFDFLSYMVSTNGNNFFGNQISGISTTWNQLSIDLSNVPGLGDVSGMPSVWFAFIFESDFSVTDEGAYVDEVLITKTTPDTPDPTADLDLELIDAPPGPFYPGEDISIQTTITNTGDAVSPDYRITYYTSLDTNITASDTVIGFLDRTGLGPGETVSINAMGPLPFLDAGNYFVGAILTVEDSNTSNNTNLDAVPIAIVPRSGNCTPALQLTCSSSVHSWNNSAAGSTQVTDEYSCIANTLQTGPEYAYSFTATVSGEHVVRLSGLADDLDLFLLGPGGSCDPGTCIASSTNAADDEAVVFNATAGTTYNFVVDGFVGSTSDYLIELSCPSPPPVADFTFTPQNPLIGQSVQFTDTSTGDPTSWSWDFGDGSTSTQSNPQRTYTSSGTFQVSLTVSNAAGSDTRVQDITVISEPPTADFIFSPQNPQAGGLVNFTDTSTGDPTTWSWTFGDGNSSTQRNPQHAYDDTGTFQVSLTVTNAAGSDTRVKSVTVSSDPPTADFIFNPQTPQAGSLVNFTDTSTGDPTTWSWNFGDGSTSVQRNPQHAYNDAGTFQVSLTVTNSAGSDTRVKSVTVSSAPPNADFTFSPPSPGVGSPVRFTDTSTGGPTSWSWNFGDGATSTDRNPTHTYSAASTFQVSLMVSNAAGTNTRVQSVSVQGSPPDAQFTFSPLRAEVGIPVQFTDASSGQPTSWSWDFGDGTTSTERNPSHTYNSAGRFGVLLRVRNSAGTDTSRQFITVDPSMNCMPARTLSCAFPTDQWNNGAAGSTQQVDEYACAPDSDESGSEFAYTFMATDSGSHSVNLSGLNADLDLFVLASSPDSVCDPESCVGFSSNGQRSDESVTFTATAGSTYEIVVDGFGGSVSDYTIELVCPDPLMADFTFDPRSPREGQTVQFGDASSGSPTRWDWDFGDGSGSAQRNPRHAYDTMGTFPVTLTVSNDFGGSSSITKNVVVGPTNATISISGPTTVEVNQARTYLASARNCVPLSNGWEWRTGGGTISGNSTQGTVSIRWSSPGTKTLTATNAACGSAVGSRTVTVNPDPTPVPPEAPSALRAEVRSPTEVELHWRDNSSNEEGFNIEASVAGSAFSTVAVVPANITRTVVGGLAPNQQFRFRVRAQNRAGESAPSNVVAATTPPDTCTVRPTNLCLNSGRFQVEVSWRDFAGATGVGRAGTLTPDTGYFWFFQDSNIELIIKILDGRQINGHFWVFYGALSNVEYTIDVTDVQTGLRRTYFNPSGNLGSLSDIEAFSDPLMSSSGSLHESIDGMMTNFDHFAFPAETPVAVQPAENMVVQGSFRSVSPKMDELDFSWTPQNPFAETTVRFQDNQDPGPGVRRFWDFGDSETLAVSSQAVEHTYRASGVYLVTLTVTRPSGIGQESQTRSKEIQVLTDPPRRQITVGGPQNGTINEIFNFSATALNCTPRLQGWSWSVDGGQIIETDTRDLIRVRWTTEGNKTIIARNSACGNAEGRRRIEIGEGNGVCRFSATVQCLNQNRFQVEVRWTTSDGSDRGRALPLTDDTGFFWFFSPSNIELAVKILDGTANNNHFWVFYGALSDVEYTIIITDTETGEVRRFRNPPGKIASFADTEAFPAN